MLMCPVPPPPPPLCLQVVPQLPLSGRWRGCSCFCFKRRQLREGDEHALKTVSGAQWVVSVLAEVDRAAATACAGYLWDASKSLCFATALAQLHAHNNLPLPCFSHLLPPLQATTARTEGFREDVSGAPPYVQLVFESPGPFLDQLQSHWGLRLLTHLPWHMHMHTLLAAP